MEKTPGAVMGRASSEIHPRPHAVYLRGLIELGNRCEKDCYYCGIRRSNRHVARYAVPHDAALQAALYAHRMGFGSVAIQAGERRDRAFIKGITELVDGIMEATGGELGITLSLGEQSSKTYREWRKAGALRYLLRIETSSPALYGQIHPQDSLHSHAERIACLCRLREEDYHVGTGVMIGIPGQTVEDLDRDLEWLVAMDVDMVGMGPYLLHPETPMAARAHELWPVEERFTQTIRMIARLRRLMPDINIAATTALQAIKPDGRDDAIRAGANVLMPNITPSGRQDDYSLYDRKPLSANCGEDSLEEIRYHVETLCGCTLALHTQGNSQHYAKRQSLGEVQEKR